MGGFEVRDLPVGQWQSDYKRYYEYVALCLDELHLTVAQLLAARHADAPDILAPAEVTEEVRLRYRKRDLLNDSIKVFSAMAVEAYLNLYGVMRLGEEQYRRLEGFGLVRKLRTILEICDGVNVDAHPQLLQAAVALSQYRNRLVHPKALDLNAAGRERVMGDHIPQVAEECFTHCRQILIGFASAAPQAIELIP